MINKLKTDQSTQSSANTTSPRSSTKNVTKNKYEHHKNKDNENHNILTILQSKNLILLLLQSALQPLVGFGLLYDFVP